MSQAPKRQAPIRQAPIRQAMSPSNTTPAGEPGAARTEAGPAKPEPGADSVDAPKSAMKKAPVKKSPATKPDAKKTGRLMTFKAPTPSRALIKTLGPINRWLCLGGIPGLRKVPGLRQIPGIRGLMNIPSIDFPNADQARLSAAVTSSTAAFITPNHPEFFTDWMIDKEVLGRVAPMAACWATHGVVNGMGALAQKFWLKNNLIAQIPGAGGADGKDHSIACALAGEGVLLHAEGQVGWHGDLIAPLFSGAVDMAIAAARSPGNKRRVLVAPVVWKLTFNEDVAPALHAELNYVEEALRLPKTRPAIGLANRLYAAYDALLAHDEINYGVHPTRAPYFKRQQQLVAILLDKLDTRLDETSAEPAKSDSADDRIRRGERYLRGLERKSDEARTLRKLVGDLRRLLRFRSEIYPGEELRQEHIAESIKRIRNDYCAGTPRDAVNKFLPQPAGPRTAHIRVPEPIDISALGDTTPVDILVDDLRRRMQMSLDGINHDLAAAGRFISYANPFVVGRG